MHFPARLPRDVISGIRENGCNTGTFSESLREKKNQRYDASGHHLKYKSNNIYIDICSRLL